MYADYVILAVVAILGCSGGLYLLSQAKKLRESHKQSTEHSTQHAL